ncbi:protein disulfide-isomerase TMX3 [Drosophila sulfurigaster albostrigata]|uniref:Protein disulfide-isomerase TMX3 n=1 Tax=Drosophila albomicans TaxID=7291 RepID=A0A6P8WZ59_DROAB|nr:protein disulfide-isomerase TMX3 [Drosophila albomicans]XP_060653077.1 protein disulfide-isomerase TMX3 [Drosophila nasuta]XP_062129057.1 protein disulfide-isomerase TMX3 [Drosophila sulfurigaster albostrigata]
MPKSMWSWSFVLLLFLLVLGTPAISSRVLELSDRFIDVRHEGQWLVMFYAPWCGYCKKTEPIFALVAQALHATNVRVGRLDCTKYPAAAREFKVRGYPTIMFIKGNMEFTYTGDRSKDELVDYALRMSGPPVQLVTRTESVDMLKGSHTIFFMFVGAQQGVVWDTYYAAAEGYQEHGFFYATSEDIAAQHFDFEQLPAVIVYKEEQHHFYPHGHVAHQMDPQDVNETIFQWVNVERFTLFPKVTRFNIHQLLKTQKYLVLAVVQEDKLNQIATHELEFRDMVEGVIRKHRARYHDQFQFGWIGEPSIAHSIILDQLPTPHLIALNSTTQHHYIPDDEPLQLTPQALHLFLESISNESATVYGGDTYFMRVNRALFEVKRSLREMWKGNPVLTTVIFGLPLGFLSLIMYSIFCGDCLVTEEEQEEDHEKRE